MDTVMECPAGGRHDWYWHGGCGLVPAFTGSCRKCKGDYYMDDICNDIYARIVDAVERAGLEWR